MENIRDSEQDIVKFVKDRIDTAKSGKDYCKFLTNFDIYRRAYNGEFKTPLPKQYSQFFVKLAFQTIDTMQAYFYDALYNHYPIAKYSGRESIDFAKAESIQHIMDYEMYHRNFIDRNLTALQWALKYGVVVTYSYWRYQVQTRNTVKYNEIIPGFKVRNVGQEPFIKYDNPSFKIIDPRRFYPDPDAGVIETENGMSTSCSYAAHDEEDDFCNLDADRESKEYFNLEEVYKDQSFQKDQSLNNDWSGNKKDDPSKQRVKLSYYWGNIDVRKKYTSDLIYVPGSYDKTTYWCVIANDKHLIKFKENPYYHGEFPYDIGNIYKSDDSLYGMSAIETILAEQDIMNMLVNLRLDNIHNLVNPSPIVWKGGLEDKEHFEHKIAGAPAYVRFAEDLGKIISYPAMPDVGSASYQQMFGQMEDAAVKNSGASPINMGMQLRTSRSATEVSQVSGAALARFKKMSFVYSNTWLTPLLKKWVQLVQQFSLEKRTGKIMGNSKEGFVQYSPEEIQGEYDVEVMDATVTNKELVSQAYTNLIAATAPYVQTGQIDAVPLLRGIIENMPLIKNADEIIRQSTNLSEEEIAGIQQMAPGVIERVKQMTAQRQGMGGGNPAQSTPGSGFNGGRSSAGMPQATSMGNTVRVGG